jgi:hypothetical protein
VRGAAFCLLAFLITACGTAASRGDDALGGLAAGMGIAALLMAAGCARGLSRRIAEYR